MQFTVLFLAQSNLLGLCRVLCPVLGIIFVLYLFDGCSSSHEYSCLAIRIPIKLLLVLWPNFRQTKWGGAEKSQEK